MLAVCDSNWINESSRHIDQAVEGPAGSELLKDEVLRRGWL
jgi:hypothetical protein